MALLTEEDTDDATRWTRGAVCSPPSTTSPTRPTPGTRSPSLLHTIVHARSGTRRVTEKITLHDEYVVSSTIREIVLPPGPGPAPVCVLVPILRSRKGTINDGVTTTADGGSARVLDLPGDHRGAGGDHRPAVPQRLCRRRPDHRQATRDRRGRVGCRVLAAAGPRRTHPRRDRPGGRLRPGREPGPEIGAHPPAQRPVRVGLPRRAGERRARDMRGGDADPVGAADRPPAQRTGPAPHLPRAAGAHIPAAAAPPVHRPERARRGDGAGRALPGRASGPRPGRTGHHAHHARRELGRARAGRHILRHARARLGAPAGARPRLQDADDGHRCDSQRRPSPGPRPARVRLHGAGVPRGPTGTSRADHPAVERPHLPGVADRLPP